jgi:ubiquinone biosynthesis protein
MNNKEQGKSYLKQISSQINRYKDVFIVLIKHGFEDLLINIKLKKYISPYRKTSKTGEKIKEEYSRWERIRMVLEELGPTFIKFGQLMSNRPDLLPQPLIIELKKLQDEVSPFSPDKAFEIIRKELNEEINEVFKSLDKEPIAAASIAQVHKGILLNDDEIIVKVQRPGIHDIIKDDIEIMYTLSKLIEKYIKGAQNFDFPGIVKEFEKTIYKELDFYIEFQHIEKFRGNFLDNNNIYVPRVYKEYSNSKILVMERIIGTPLSEIEKFNDTEQNKEIAINIVESMLKQIFEHGFFHADPHAGNILALKENKICFLDFGMMGILLPKYRQIMADIMIGFMQKNERKITKAIIKLSENKNIKNEDRFELEIYELIERYYSVPLKQINVAELLNKLIKLVISHNIKLPSNITFLFKSMMNIENIARDLYPNINMIEHIKPYAKNIIKERMGIKSFFKNFYNTSLELFNLLKDLPYETRSILSKIKEGEFKIVMEHKDFDKFISKNEQISNRISFSIVLASLIIGSSLIVLADIPPKWNDISVIGLLGFLSAGIMGFWLLISIIKHGKM